MDVETHTVLRPPAPIREALACLTANAVTTRLCPDTHTMQFARKWLLEWLTFHLEDCRPVFTEALRFTAGMCIRCGDDTPRHPARNPTMPALWCRTCFDRGAWENWGWGVPMKRGPKGAGSKKQREDDDALFDGIGDDDEDALEGESLFSAADAL